MNIITFCSFATVGLLILLAVGKVAYAAMWWIEKRKIRKDIKKWEVPVAWEMKKLILLLLFVGFSVKSITYTEWYVDSSLGGNTNAGTAASGAPTFAAMGFWTNATWTFYNATLNPSGFNINDFAAVYTNTSCIAQFIARIVATNATTITLQNTNMAGTAPPTDVAGNTWIVTGGAWKGPNTNSASTVNGGNPNSDSGFPLNIISGALTNSAANMPCFNFKTGVYPTTNGITLGANGPMRISGYGTSVRDGTAATLDGGATGTSFILLTFNSKANIDVTDFVFSNNGNSGTPNSINANGTLNQIRRCVFHDFRMSAVSVTADTLFSECEAYNCNKAGQNGEGGFKASLSSMFKNCISHDNTGDGFNTVGPMINCIAYKNSKNGYSVQGSTSMLGCDSYSNTLAGIDLGNATPRTVLILNCNLIKNGGCGITNSSNATHQGVIAYCGFGSGGVTNGGSGSIAANVTSSIFTNNLTTYAANQTPWTDPDNANFKISLTAAKSIGYGAFLQSTVNSPTNTVAYPDIGAAQSVSTNATAAAAGGSYTFAQ